MLFFGVRFPRAANSKSARNSTGLDKCCLPGALAGQKKGSDPTEVQHLPQDVIDGLDWPRTTKDPFEGVWEIIFSGALAHPEWSGSDLFQEVQRLFPGRYLPSQQSTLQHGLRKIRAHLLEILHEPWPHEVIQASLLTPGETQAKQQEGGISPTLLDSPAASSLWAQAEASRGKHQPPVEDEITAPHVPAIPIANEPRQPFNKEERQHPQELQIRHLTMTIEDAIGVYLQEQRNAGRRRKTLEWHQTALGFLQQYLVKERHLTFLSQLTESEVRGWLAFLHTPSSLTGLPRKASTIVTYGRSVRAFCHWAVRKGYLQQTPMVRGILPKAEKKRVQVIESEAFDRLLLACRPAGESAATLDRVAARNRSILWILMDTGMRVSELCGLRLSDVNREQRSLRVQGRGNERWLPLSPNGWFQLLSYLEQYRPKEGFSAEEPVQEVPLFFCETYQPLTINALTLVFGRLRKRAGMTEDQVTASLLRETFAVRYLQASGEPEALRVILGLTGMESVKRYEQISTQKIEDEPQKEPAERHRSKVMAVPQKSTQRRRRPSSAATRNHQQPGTDRSS
jgi:site-specific recombinase XerD